MDFPWNGGHNSPSKFSVYFFRKAHFLFSVELATVEINIEKYVNSVWTWLCSKKEKSNTIKKVTKYKSGNS